MEVRSWLEFFNGRSDEKDTEALTSPGSITFALCGGGALASAGVALTICSGFLALSPWARVLIVRLFLAIAILLWISVASSMDHYTKWRIARTFSVAALASGPIAAMVLQVGDGDPRFAFWLTLVIWICLSAAGIHRYAEPGLHGLLLVALAVWSTSGAIIGLGSTQLLPFARQAMVDLYAIHAFLDIRTLSGAVTVMAAGSLAVVRVFSRALPVPPSLGKFQLSLNPKSSQSEAIMAFLEAIYALTNGVLAVIRELLDVLYKAVVVIIRTFLRIGAELATILRELWQNRGAVAWLVTVAVSFCLLLFVFALAKNSGPHVVSYLISSGWWSQIRGLGSLVWRFALVLFCVLGLVWFVTGKHHISISSTVYSMTAMLGIVLMAAVIMYVLSRIAFLAIAGFVWPGPYTVGFLIVVGSGLAVSRRLGGGSSEGETNN